MNQNLKNLVKMIQKLKNLVQLSQNLKKSSPSMSDSQKSRLKSQSWTFDITYERFQNAFIVYHFSHHISYVFL